MTIVYYDVKPSLVLRHLKITNSTLKLAKEAAGEDELAIVERRKDFDIVFDPEGKIGFCIRNENLESSIQALKDTLKESKLPTVYEEEALLHVPQWAFMSGLDKQLFENHGITIDFAIPQYNG